MTFFVKSASRASSGSFLFIQRPQRSSGVFAWIQDAAPQPGLKSVCALRKSQKRKLLGVL
jgi:hypothetical protein